MEGELKKLLGIIAFYLAVLGLSTGGLIAAVKLMSAPERTCTEIRQAISPYVHCMSRAGELGCSMQVEDFREYHELKREHAKLCLRQ